MNDPLAARLAASRSKILSVSKGTVIIGSLWGAETRFILTPKEGEYLLRWWRLRCRTGLNG